MGVISDAANLPQLSPSGLPNFMDGEQNANAVADEGIQTIADTAKQQKQAEMMQMPFQSIKYTADPKTGKYKIGVEMPQDTFDYLGTLLQTGQATIQAFGEARAQLQAKREFQERNPIISALGKISSTAAAQYASSGRGRDISPIIRAAGAYGLEQFGQTNAELSQQEAQLTGQQFGVAKQLYTENQQDQALQIANKRADNQAAKEDKRFGITFTGQLRQTAREAGFTEESQEGLEQQLVDSGLYTAETAKPVAKSLVAESLTRRKILDAEAKTKLDAEEVRALSREKNTLRIQSEINGRLARSQNDKDEERAVKDADMLELARGVASGDATSLNIYGLRAGGADRAKFLAMIQRIDPSLDQAKIQARVDAVRSLGDTTKNGTTGTQLQMFDTLLQHTGELERVARDLGGTNSPIFNKPLNKIRSQVLGDPKLQRFLVVSAAVGKEYEGVLLRGRALYASDREELEKFMSSSLSLKQILATVDEQRKVSFDRIKSANTSFKRTVGRDLPANSLTDESKMILLRSGLKLPIEDNGMSSVDLSQFER